MNNHVFALVVAVGHYRHLARLKRTPTDGNDFCEVLASAGVPSEQLVRLIDEQATADAIRGGLNSLKQAGKNDTAIIFFSGHGLRSTSPDSGDYLCPVEADLDSPDNTCISSHELTTAIRALSAGRVIMFIDACHAGGVGEPKTAGSTLRGGLSNRTYEQLGEGRGRVIIAACRADEVAWELGGMRNGLFSTYLLQGLCGQVAREDGAVWVSDLFGFIYRCVVAYRLQHPYQKANAEDFCIIQSARTTTSMPAAVSLYPNVDEHSRDIDLRRLRQMIHRLYDRPELELLCADVGLQFHDLAGETLETKMLHLIDRFHRRGQLDCLIRQISEDHKGIDLSFLQQ